MEQKLIKLCVDINTVGATKAQLKSYIKRLKSLTTQSGIIERLEEIEFCMDIDRTTKLQRDEIAMEIYSITSDLTNNR